MEVNAARRARRRRYLRQAVVGRVVAGLALTGCTNVLTGGPPPVPYEHDTGATDVLIAIDRAGGFVQLETTFRNTPEFLLVGDRTAIAPAPVPDSFPAPAIYHMRSVSLSEERVQELLRTAADSGLLAGEIEYGDPGWTDLPYTNVYIAVGGRTYWQSAYGLGVDDDTSAELSGAERAARAALWAFIDFAMALVAADSARYTPTALVVHRVSPTAVNAVDPDFDAEPVAWPIATVPPPLPAMNFEACVVVTGAEVATLLAALEEATELTPWVIGTDPPARVAFRPMLGDDPGCPE